MKNPRTCVGCIVRYVETGCRKADNLKHLSMIFDMHPSDIDRHFREAKGITIKQHLDGVKKEKLLVMLRNGNVYGYEFGEALGFRDDHAFYHWVKRAFGVTFKELRIQHGTTNTTSRSQRSNNGKAGRQSR